MRENSPQTTGTRRHDLVERLLEFENACLLAARFKSGKSLLALALAIVTATGGS